MWKLCLQLTVNVQVAAMQRSTITYMLMPTKLCSGAFDSSAIFSTCSTFWDITGCRTKQDGNGAVREGELTVYKDSGSCRHCTQVI